MSDEITEALEDGIVELFNTDGVDVHAIVVMVREGEGFGLRAFAKNPAAMAQCLQKMALGSLPEGVMYRG